MMFAKELGRPTLHQRRETQLQVNRVWQTLPSRLQSSSETTSCRRRHPAGLSRNHNQTKAMGCRPAARAQPFCPSAARLRTAQSIGNQTEKSESLLVRVSEIDGWKLGAVQTPLTEVRSLIRPQDPTSPLGFSPGSQPGTSLHASRAVKVLEEAQSKQREQQLLSTAYLARALPPPKQAVPHSCGW